MSQIGGGRQGLWQCACQGVVLAKELGQLSKLIGTIGKEPLQGTRARMGQRSDSSNKILAAKPGEFRRQCFDLELYIREIHGIVLDSVGF